MLKIVITLLTISIVGGGSFALYKGTRYQKEAVPTAVKLAELTQQTVEGTTQGTAGEPEVEIVPPIELNLQMDFYAQAPFGNWDYPWQEACEEASILLVANEYFGHNWTVEQFNDQILEMVEWEKDRFGDYWHTTAAQTAEILRDELGLESVVHKNPTLNDVKKILAKGHFIVGFFDGKKLGNPFYKNGGPVYHVMVVKGYKADGKIITHDVGTRRGEDYVYTWATIENALHDYAEPMEDGEKVMLEVLPPGYGF